MNLEELRDDIIIKQKKGLPFIGASVVIWSLITIVVLFDFSVKTRNILVFCCSCPMLPLAWIIGKQMKVNLFDKSNPLSSLGFLFTLNQLLYILIVMWVFNEVPEKMIMVYAMVFGAHLFPYSWLYKSNSYKVFSIMIPIVALFLGNLYSPIILSVVMIILEIIFVFTLNIELKSNSSK